MKNKILCAFFALAIAVSAVAATAVGKLIHIELTAPDKIFVDGKPATTATLTTVVSSLIQDKEHTAVEIKAPEKMDKAKIEEIKEACRKAGISLFSISTKS